MGNLPGAVWHKSTRSGDNGGDCVEVADNLPDIVAVRDSKTPGPMLTFTPEAWSAFIAATKAGALSRGAGRGSA